MKTWQVQVEDTASTGASGGAGSQGFVSARTTEGSKSGGEWWREGQTPALGPPPGEPRPEAQEAVVAHAGDRRWPEGHQARAERRSPQGREGVGEGRVPLAWGSVSGVRGGSQGLV